MDKLQLGARIRQTRENREMTLDELSSEIGLHKSTLSRYERGEIDSPKLPVIQSIAECLHVNPDWLVGKSQDKSYSPSKAGIEVYTPCNLFAPLKTMRDARELSPEEAAFGIGISSDDYKKIEQGHNTDCITLARIANFFCCTADFILAFDGISNESSHISFTHGPLFRLHQAFGKLKDAQQEAVISYAELLSTDESATLSVIDASNNVSPAEMDMLGKFRSLDTQRQDALLHSLEYEYSILPGDKAAPAPKEA